MATLGVPRNDTLLEPDGRGNVYRLQTPWQQFFNAIAKRLNRTAAITAVVSPDAAAAPAAYSQAHIQTMVTELNELKTQFNALVAAQNT